MDDLNKAIGDLRKAGTVARLYVDVADALENMRDAEKKCNQLDKKITDLNKTFSYLNNEIDFLTSKKQGYEARAKDVTKQAEDAAYNIIDSAKAESLEKQKTANKKLKATEAAITEAAAQHIAFMETNSVKEKELSASVAKLEMAMGKLHDKFSASWQLVRIFSTLKLMFKRRLLLYYQQMKQG